MTDSRAMFHFCSHAVKEAHEKRRTDPRRRAGQQRPSPILQYDLIENYEGQRYAIFRARGVSAFGKRIDDVFYEMTDTDRIPLDWQPEIFAPIPDEQVPSFFFGL